VPPRVKASVNQSVLTGCHKIITREFAYGKSQVRVSSTGYSTSTRHVICVSKGASACECVSQSVGAHRVSYDYNACVCIRQITS